MNVEVWADVVCPWCYLGKRNLDEALSLFAHRDAVSVIWRSFELDPNVSIEDDRPVVDVLVEKYGSDVENILASQAHLTDLGRNAGIDFAFDKTTNVNSFDAHRVVQYSAKAGLQHATVERLFRAHFAEGLRVSDHAVLLRCSEEVGLDIDEVASILASDLYVDDVRIAESTAQELGVTGVPFCVFDRRYAVSGAQSPDVLLDVLERAWSESESRSPNID